MAEISITIPYAHGEAVGSLTIFGKNKSEILLRYRHVLKKDFGSKFLKSVEKHIKTENFQAVCDAQILYYKEHS